MDQLKASGLPALMVACATIEVSVVGQSPVPETSDRRDLTVSFFFFKTGDGAFLQGFSTFHTNKTTVSKKAELGLNILLEQQDYKNWKVSLTLSQYST